MDEDGGLNISFTGGSKDRDRLQTKKSLLGSGRGNPRTVGGCAARLRSTKVAAAGE
jgi:hypothetical protein